MRSIQISEGCNCLTIIGNTVTEGIGTSGTISASKLSRPTMLGKRVVRATMTSSSRRAGEPDRHQFSAPFSDENRFWIHFPRAEQQEKLFEVSALDAEHAIQDGVRALGARAQAARPGSVARSSVIHGALETNRLVIVFIRDASGCRLCLHDRKPLLSNLAAIAQSASEKISGALSGIG